MKTTGSSAMLPDSAAAAGSAADRLPSRCTIPSRFILALGATAAKAVVGPTVGVRAQRGRVLRTPLAEAGFATVHPSSVLRAPGDVRVAAERAFVGDLKKITRYLASHPR